MISTSRIPTPVTVAMVASLAVPCGFAVAVVLADAPFLVASSGLFLLTSLWVMHKEAGLFNFRSMSIPAFCFLNYLAIVLIPSFFVFADKREPFRSEYLFAVESGLLTIPLGVLCVNKMFRFNKRETAYFFQAPLLSDNTDPSPVCYVLVLGTAIVLMICYLLEVRTVPLFYLLSHPGQYDMLARLREESGKLLESRLNYLYDLVKTLIYPLLVPLGFGRWMQTKRWQWGFLFLLALTTGMLYGGLTIQKSPVALLLVVLCSFYYVYRNGRVGVRFLVAFIVLFLAFPIFVLTRQYAGEFTLLKSLEVFSHRLFYVPAEVLYYYFEVFPRVVPYQHGLTIDKLAKLLGDEPYNSPNVVGRYMNPDTFYSVSANAPFLGNLNADFGFLGVVIGGFLAGAVMQVVQVRIVRRGKSLLTGACYAVLLVNFVNLDHTALPIVLGSDGTLLVLVLAAMIRALESSLRQLRPTKPRSGRIRFRHSRFRSMPA